MSGLMGQLQSRTGPCCARHGHRATAASAGPDPPRRPRRAIRGASLSRPLAGAPHALPDELQGRLLGQRATESYVATPKGELVQVPYCQTRDQATADVFQCIEHLYGKRRLHSARGEITPEQRGSSVPFSGIHRAIAFAKAGEAHGPLDGGWSFLRRE
jgi:hypothetical protein